MKLLHLFYLVLTVLSVLILIIYCFQTLQQSRQKAIELQKKVINQRKKALNQSQQKPTPQYKTQLPSSTQTYQSQEKPALTNASPLPDLKSLQWKPKPNHKPDVKNAGLQQKLLTLLRNDVVTAKRLLRHQREVRPGQSDNWYLEKVIHDLERDRHC